MLFVAIGVFVSVVSVKSMGIPRTFPQSSRTVGSISLFTPTAVFDLYNGRAFHNMVRLALLRHNGSTMMIGTNYRCVLPERTVTDSVASSILFRFVFQTKIWR